MQRTIAEITLFGFLLAADQLSKWWIIQPDFHPFAVVDGFFNVVRAYNPGVAFSMFAHLPEETRAMFLLSLTIGIAIVILLWWVREHYYAGPISWLLAAILAGAVGNIWDRWEFGYVVDFIDWYVTVGGQEYHWPAFNLADAYISVGVVLLLISKPRIS